MRSLHRTTTALQSFYAGFPEYAKNALRITGESYAVVSQATTRFHWLASQSATAAWATKWVSVRTTWTK